MCVRILIINIFLHKSAFICFCLVYYILHHEMHVKDSSQTLSLFDSLTIVRHYRDGYSFTHVIFLHFAIQKSTYLNPKSTEKSWFLTCVYVDVIQRLEFTCLSLVTPSGPSILKLHYAQFRQQLYFKPSKHTSFSLCFLIFGSGFTVQIKLTVSKRYMRYKTTLSLLFSLSWVFFWFYVSQVPIKLQSSNDNNLYFFFHTLLTISTYSLSNLLNFKCKDLISFEVSFQSFAYEVIRN